MGLKVNKEQLSKILGKSTTTLTTYQKNGLPIFQDGARGQANLYDTADVVNWLIEYQTNKFVNINEGGEQKYNLEQERARREKEAADKLEMQNAVARKELLPVQFLRDALESVANQIVAILESLPIRIKNRVPELTHRDIEMTKSEIVKARNAAAEVRL